MKPESEAGQIEQLEAWLGGLPDPILDEETLRILKERVRAELATQCPGSTSTPAVPPHLRVAVQAAVRAELHRSQRRSVPRRWLAAAAVLVAATAGSYWHFHSNDWGAQDPIVQTLPSEEDGDLLALETDLADLELNVYAMDYILFDAPPDGGDAEPEIEQLVSPRYQMNF